MIISTEEDVIEAKRILALFNENKVDEQIIRAILRILQKIANGPSNYLSSTEEFNTGGYSNIVQKYDAGLYRLDVVPGNSDIIETFVSFFKVACSQKVKFNDASNDRRNSVTYPLDEDNSDLENQDSYEEEDEEEEEEEDDF